MTASIDRYAAFISYRHSPRDRHWALRIMAALETYRTPKPLQAEAFPARIGRLFRDEDEIPASDDLSDQIKEALTRSDNLIVICSPDTPNSRWVRREIQLFQAMGKRRADSAVVDQPAKSRKTFVSSARIAAAQPLARPARRLARGKL